MDLNNVRIDATKEAQGVLVDIDSTTKLLIGSAKGLVYRKALREKLRKRIEELDGVALSEDAIEEITTYCMAEHLLLGWEGLMEGEDEVDYSVEKSIEILTDPAYRQFKDFVTSKAEDISLFRDTSKDVIVGDVKK